MSKEEIIKSHYGECSCDPMYKNRGKTDPNCFICYEGSEVGIMMEEYARQETETLRIELEALREDNKKLQSKVNQLKSVFKKLS
jgi:hypothetical protein